MSVFFCKSVSGGLFVVKKINVNKNYNFKVKSLTKVSLSRVLKRIYKKCSMCNEVKLYNKFEKKKAQCRKCRNEKYHPRKTTNVERSVKRSRITFNCDFCGKESTKTRSEYERKKNHFCNKECHDKWNEKVKCNCTECNKEIFLIKTHYNKSENHFCNSKCMGKYMSKTRVKENNVRWNGGNVKCNCDFCGKDIEVKRSIYKIRKNNFCNLKCMGEWKSINEVGEKNRNYNPNLTDEDRKYYRKADRGLKKFIKGVYERDRYTCQCCGKVGGKLNAHHLNGYHWDKGNRINIDNGVTLCASCHKDFHKTYGNKYNTKEQFCEYMDNRLNKSA